jgi:hypothetical protein
MYVYYPISIFYSKISSINQIYIYIYVSTIKKDKSMNSINMTLVMKTTLL